MALVNRGSLSTTLLLRGVAGVLAGGVLACGDSLVDGSFQGSARFTVEGSVNGTSEFVNEKNPEVIISVFWMPRGTLPGGADVLVEQPGTAVRAEYYRKFQVRLFDEPEAGNLVTLGSGARYGIARLGAYRDVNGNRRRDEGEPLLGLSDGRALMRVPEVLPARASPTGAPLAAGWHIVSTPFDCPPTEGAPPGGSTPGGSSPVPVPDGECAVPLGASCKNDVECGTGGVCILEYRGPWPGGACAIPEPPREGCRQRGSVFVGSPDSPTTGYWLKGCQVSDDCGRAAPYQCDQQNRACMPTAEIPVDLQDSMSSQPLCRTPDSSRSSGAAPVP